MYWNVFVIILIFNFTNRCQGFDEDLYEDDEVKCEAITVPLCQNMAYNKTLYPNILGHANQADAGLEVHQYYPLATLGCSKDLKLFLCGVYVPVCTNWGKPIKPCRHLCMKARLGCEKLLNDFNFEWPRALNCESMPEKPSLCFSSTGGIPDSPGVPNIPSDTRCGDTFECPSYMKIPDSPQQDGYSFMGEPNCAAPCDRDKIMYWTAYDQDFAHWWIGIWSVVCCVSTLFTVLTYLIDMSRFRYPERPIVFLSGCYLIVSIAYLIGFIKNDEVSCSQSCVSGNCNQIVVQGTKEAGCTIVFMLLYFFSMASSIWWVVLTVTWFLAAGLKWGNEAIEAISHYFHLVAWAIPATLTIIILAMARIEGEVLSGVCFVGVYDAPPLLWFILIPLVVFLCTGTGFLIAGFIAMFHIRTVVKNSADGKKVEKLERLMVRIGIFSVLYTVPATVTIACYFYEYTHIEVWMKAWIQKDCMKIWSNCCLFVIIVSAAVYFANCIKNLRNADIDYQNAKPDFIVFVIKYFMMLIVGVTSGFWIWSGKTFESWGNFRRRLCCCCSRQNGSRMTDKSSSILTPRNHMNMANQNMYVRGHAAL